MEQVFFSKDILISEMDELLGGKKISVTYRDENGKEVTVTYEF